MDNIGKALNNLIVADLSVNSGGGGLQIMAFF